jgi:hypothetical protein
MSEITRGPTNHRAGASHPKARLTDKQVKEIREIYATGGIGYGFLAEYFKCGASTVRDIVQYRTRWAA